MDFDLEQQLAATTRFARLQHVVSCDSTQRLAQEDDLAGWAIYWADHQTAGRGRQGRSWHDSAADDLAVTLRLTDLLLRNPTRLAAAIPVAVRQAIAAVGGEDLACRMRIKWPNDLLLDNRKVSGILIDSAGQPPTVHHVGIGINVNRATFPEDLAAGSASLALALGTVLDRSALLLALASAVDTAVSHLESGATDALAAAFRDGLGLLGRRVRATTGQRTVGGVLTAMDLDDIVIDDQETLALAHCHHVTLDR